MRGQVAFRLLVGSIVGVGLTVAAHGVGDATGHPASTTANAAAPEIPTPSRPPAEIGIASWYGLDHQGKPTASGKRFDRRKLTAAHPTLPLNSKAKVTNLDNGRSVEVTINDRGPGAPGRAIDLSERAAKTLGMKKEGLAPVAIEPIGTHSSEMASR